MINAKPIYHKLISLGYEYNLLHNSFMILCHRYEAGAKHDESRYEKVFSVMLTLNDFVICNLNNTDINNII